MGRRARIDVERAVAMYTRQHCTLLEIGRVFGVSKEAVRKALKNAGIGREQGEWVPVVCRRCGETLAVPRHRWRRQQTFAHGQCGSARAVVARHFRLHPEHIVIHHDGNAGNTAVENLGVVAHRGEQLRVQQGAKVPLVWDGRAEGAGGCSGAKKALK